jgi:hypothetical protein
MNARAVVSFPEQLSNQELIAALPPLVRRESHAIAELVAHLAEVDARRLYRDQAFPSMHQYCVDALHLSEGAAYKRIAAARTARRFPVILEMLAGGRLHLSAVCLLAPHLTEENHPSLLEAAVHRSKRRVELLMAERFPRPDVPQSIRKLPAPQPEMAVPSPIAKSRPALGADAALRARESRSIGSQPAVRRRRRDSLRRPWAPPAAPSLRPE